VVVSDVVLGSVGLEIFEAGHRPNTLLSFGDKCYANNVVSKHLLIRNTGNSPVEVSLAGPDSDIAGYVSMKDLHDILEMDKASSASEDDVNDDIMQNDDIRQRGASSAPMTSSTASELPRQPAIATGDMANEDGVFGKENPHQHV
jgi:hypothetical protein